MSNQNSHIFGQDCFGRPIASAPDAWFDVVERYSNDSNKTLKYISSYYFRPIIFFWISEFLFIKFVSSELQYQNELVNNLLICPNAEEQKR